MKSLNILQKNYNLRLLTLCFLLSGTLILIPKGDLIAVGESTSLTLPTLIPSVKEEDEFQLPIFVNSNGENIFSVDVVLIFTKEKIELIDIIPGAKDTNLKTFYPTNENDDFDRERIKSEAKQEGEIRFGAVTLEGGDLIDPFNGVLDSTNPFATLRFRALEEGEVTIRFDFTPGSEKTDDSNLISYETGKDTLDDTNFFSFSVLPKKGLQALDIPEEIRIPNPLKAETIEEFIQDLIDFIFYLALALAPLMIIIAGFYYLTAAGDPKRIQTAKQIILYASIGLGIVLLAKALISVVIGALGG